MSQTPRADSIQPALWFVRAAAAIALICLYLRGTPASRQTSIYVALVLCASFMIELYLIAWFSRAAASETARQAYDERYFATYLRDSRLLGAVFVAASACLILTLVTDWTNVDQLSGGKIGAIGGLIACAAVLLIGALMALGKHAGLLRSIFEMGLSGRRP